MEDHESSIVPQNQTGDHISLDIEIPNEGLVTSIRRKMETISSSHSICRVKESLRKTNEKAYVPNLVSIGPYHHGAEGLKTMEEHKWRYVHALLSRKPNLESCLNDCVAAIKEVEYRAQACYAEEINFSNDQFLEMMLVDGCFIIELLLKYSVKSLRRRNDPIFNTPGMLFDLRCNLTLLENQIPLFILQRLFQLVPIPIQCNYSFPELSFRFFKNMIPGDPKIHREKFNQEGNHLLDLICHCLLPTYPRVQKKKPNSEKHLDSATELQAAGIRLRKGRTENLPDVKFVNGVLEIPHIVVHQYTKSLLSNLIAFEHCSSDNMQHITSYVVFMKSLIRSDKDAKLLQRQDILTNYDATDKEVAKLFEKLNEEVTVKEFYYDGLCEQIQEYKSKHWRGWYKRVKRNRQKKPIIRLVLLVATLALLVTLVGTLFSVLSFFLHRF